MTEEWINKYRPTRLEDVVGQDVIVRSLRDQVKKRSAKAYLFMGPSGTGKTTLARIVANMFGCGENVNEINAAVRTGVDDMREVTSALEYIPLGGGNQAVIVDEVQQLSKAAFNAILKTLEEPPDWLYWFLCTTEPTRVPETIRTRCAKYTMRSLSPNELFDLLDDISAKEGILDSDEGGKIISVCAKEAGGSPREAVNNLAKCSECRTREEAVALLASADNVPEAIELAKGLLNGLRWPQVRELLEGLKDTNPESIRQVVRAYIGAVALKATDPAKASHACAILDAFDKPCHPNDKITPILMSVAGLVLQ
jgi:DNA polymerase III gamma/tau subunit